MGAKCVPYILPLPKWQTLSVGRFGRVKQRKELYYFLGRGRVCEFFTYSLKILPLSIYILIYILIYIYININIYIYIYIYIAFPLVILSVILSVIL